MRNIRIAMFISEETVFLNVVKMIYRRFRPLKSFKRRPIRRILRVWATVEFRWPKLLAVAIIPIKKGNTTMQKSKLFHLSLKNLDLKAINFKAISNTNNTENT